MNIELVFISYNRLDYTQLALTRLLADPEEDFHLTIWDNASEDGTGEWLRENVSDPRVREIVCSRENIGQTAAINEVWSRSRADLLGKVDNDCLVSPGWTRLLAQAHADVPELGVVACWHFFPEDFDYARACRKIQRFGTHQVLRHPWTCGTGLLLKREAYERFGPIEKSATTSYWLRMARAGLVNGFYYPLIYQEHMDDPRSIYSRMHRHRFEDAYRDTYGYQQGRIRNLEQYDQLHRDILEDLLSGPWQASCYVGWRRRLRHFSKRVRLPFAST